MDANLVGATSVQRGLGQGSAAQPLEHAITGSSLASQVIIHRHPPAVRAVAGDRGSNLTPFPLNFSADNRMINFVDFPRRKLGGERQVRFVVFGNNHAATGFFIQPMNDSWPGYAADAAQLFATMVQQRVDERVALVA